MCNYLPQEVWMTLLQAGGKRDLFYFAPAQGTQRQVRDLISTGLLKDS